MIRQFSLTADCGLNQSTERHVGSGGVDPAGAREVGPGSRNRNRQRFVGPLLVLT
jgi:hypothetical protein